MNVKVKKSYKADEHLVICEDPNDLAVDKILKTLSAVKGRLMLECALIHIKRIECSMTPEVKKHLVEAGKKLRMYGKKAPVIARFDEYGNRLPDEIEIGDTSGITVKLVDPKDYGEFYLELKSIEFPNIDYSMTNDFIYKGASDIREFGSW